MPDLGYIFIVTYGRSGSTLLQGILNSIPGYLVRGENRQALRHLYAFHTAAVQERRRQRRGQHAAGPALFRDPDRGLQLRPRRRRTGGLAAPWPLALRAARCYLASR